MVDAPINQCQQIVAGERRMIFPQRSVDTVFGGKAMMKRAFAALALLSVAAFLPGVAQARGYGRSGGYVNTPFGQFNMQTMAQAGGDPMMAQQLQQQRMMYQQQQM